MTFETVQKDEGDKLSEKLHSKREGVRKQVERWAASAAWQRARELHFSCVLGEPRSTPFE